MAWRSHGKTIIKNKYMELKRDGFFFYRSFYDAIQLVPNDESKLKLYEALCEYAILGKDPQLDGWDLALFMTWRINVDKANSRREASIQNGSRGGRPAKPKKTQIEPEENLEKFNKFIEKHSFQSEKPVKNLNNNINSDADISENGNKHSVNTEGVINLKLDELTVEEKIKEIDLKFDFEKRYFQITKEKNHLKFEEKIKELMLQYNELFKTINLPKLNNSNFINMKCYEKWIKNHSEPKFIFYELIQLFQPILPSDDPRIHYLIE